MAISNSWVVFTLLSIVSGVIYLSSSRKKHPLPPGPPGFPIIGNIPQLPTRHPWKQFHAWTKEYGPIYRLLAGRDTIIVLGDYDTAHELLDVRSANYSSRPYLPMAGELLYKGMHTLLRPWDEPCKRHKRMAAPLLSVSASRRYIPLQEMESLQLLEDLLRTNDFASAIHRYAASLMFSLVYGFRIEQLDEPAMLDSHLIQEHFVAAMQQGQWVVDAIPLLRHLPAWMAPFKRLAQQWFEFEADRHRKNVRVALDSPSWNWAKELVTSKEAKSLPELDVAYNAGILVDAGLDTTGQTLELFVMTAINHPNKVVLAQAELDRVVGQQRLPTFQDQLDLPYVNAFIEELLRWRPLMIGGVPHSNLHEDFYNGYRIPKGSVILAPFWSIHMDEKIYGDPENFRPERWLEKGEQSLPNVAFGFGRRACTGMTIARQSLFTVISRILWAFNIKAELDDSGCEIEVDSMALDSGLTAGPEPFKVRFQPRHLGVATLVKEAWDSTETDIGRILDSFER